METLTARMPNPAVLIPEAMKPIRALFGSISGGGVPETTLELVHLRVSQVLMIATTNFFNRLNVSTRQPAGAWR